MHNCHLAKISYAVNLSRKLKFNVYAPWNLGNFLVEVAYLVQCYIKKTKMLSSFNLIVLSLLYVWEKKGYICFGTLV